MEQEKKTISLYDTTLRDGAQRRGISLSLQDKLKITKLLDSFGVKYIEGGWPGSNPKDCEYFKLVRDIEIKESKITAFGSTRRASNTVEDDPNLKALLEAETPVVTIVGKSSLFQVKEILRTTPEQNIIMIQDTVRWMKEQGREVIYDGEHFFDGYLEDSSYALETFKAAAEAGADLLVLCDTNGGILPDQVSEITAKIASELNTPLGIHAHNDSGVAVANSIAAVEAGCSQVQGTINGYGERCGNANLISVAANLQIKLGYHCVTDEALRSLTTLARKVSGIANLNPDKHAPFVGSSAFAHKGGIHVAAVEKNPASYEHINPELIGNERKFVISELSGKGNIRVRASEMGLKLKGNGDKVLSKIKDLESRGFQFENAEGTFELMVRKEEPGYVQPFEVIDMIIVSEQRAERSLAVNAMIKIKVGDEIFHTASEGDGPVHAIDGAMRKALLPTFPELAVVKLADFKVRILDPDKATAATTRVTIEATALGERWSTVGCSYNIIEASYHALADSYALYLLRTKEQVVDEKQTS